MTPIRPLLLHKDNLDQAKAAEASAQQEKQNTGALTTARRPRSRRLPLLSQSQPPRAITPSRSSTRRRPRSVLPSRVRVT